MQGQVDSDFLPSRTRFQQKKCRFVCRFYTKNKLYIQNNWFLGGDVCNNKTFIDTYGSIYDCIVSTDLL